MIIAGIFKSQKEIAEMAGITQQAVCIAIKKKEKVIKRPLHFVDPVPKKYQLQDLPQHILDNINHYCTLFRFGDQEKRCEKQCEGCKRVIQ